MYSVHTKGMIMTPSQVSVEQTRGRTPARRRMSKGAAKKSTKKRKAPASAVINLRTDTDTRALIDRAAAASGQNRTAFMLQSARIQAEHVLLNQVYFDFLRRAGARRIVRSSKTCACVMIIPFVWTLYIHEYM